MILSLWFLGLTFTSQPPWPNGQGVGLLIRRLRVRVPQGVAMLERMSSGTIMVVPFHAGRRSPRTAQDPGSWRRRAQACWEAAVPCTCATPDWVTHWETVSADLAMSIAHIPAHRCSRRDFNSQSPPHEGGAGSIRPHALMCSTMRRVYTRAS